MGFLTRMANRDFDKLMTERIKNFQGIETASNQDSKLYLEMFDVNEFLFLSVKIIGVVNIQTFNGCTISFNSNQGTLEVPSDSTEFDTDISRTLGLGFTEFDIELEEELIHKIVNEEIESIIIQHKKDIFEFENVNLAVLQKEIEEISQ